MNVVVRHPAGLALAINDQSPSLLPGPSQEAPRAGPDDPSDHLCRAFSESLLRYKLRLGHYGS